MLNFAARPEPHMPALEFGLTKPQPLRFPTVRDGAALLLALCVSFTARPALANDTRTIPLRPVTRSSQGQPELQSLINAGSLADLRWPDFIDYRANARQFYGAGGYALAWSDGGRPTPQALAMVELFKQAGAKGLNPDDYDASRWDARLAKLAPAFPNPAATDLVHFDLAMTVCAMRFISDLRIGRVNPRHVRFALDVDHNRYDLAGLLRNRVIRASDVNAAIADVEPHYEGYQRVEAALAIYRKLAAEGDGTPLPATQKGIRPGGIYAGMPQLVARLRQLGDLPSETAMPAGQTAYAGDVVGAVRHFQRRHGLDADGILGKATIRQLNTPLSYRVKQLEFALERYRWIPRAFAQPPIVINIPEFVLRTMRHQAAPLLTMRVIVGQAYRTRTPVFTANMRYVIFRPYWNVPLSIQRNELVPKIRRDRNYLADNDFEVVDGAENVVTDGRVSDDVLSELRSGELGIRQKPGPENALGLVKFIFPNRYNVYMHDTPFAELFVRARRDFSHGCIRVENAPALAAWVLRDNPEWSEDKILAAMNGDETIQVNLAKPIPVLILYSTAVIEPDGEVKFFDDIYGHDAVLQEALARGYPYDESSGADAARSAVGRPPASAEPPY